VGGIRGESVPGRENWCAKIQGKRKRDVVNSSFCYYTPTPVLVASSCLHRNSPNSWEVELLWTAPEASFLLGNLVFLGRAWWKPIMLSQDYARKCISTAFSESFRDFIGSIGLWLQKEEQMYLLDTWTLVYLQIPLLSTVPMSMK
jgi:hypothetical protein